MKKIIFASLFITSSILHASYYIQVFKTKYYDDVLQEELNMNILGYNTKIAYKNHKYTLYTGPYRAEKEAKKAFYFTKEYYKSARLIKKERNRKKLRLVSGIDNSAIIKSKKKIVPPKKLVELSENEHNRTVVEVVDINQTDEHYFVGISYGASYLSTIRDNNRDIKINEPESISTFYKLDTGYIYNNLMLTLDYSNTSNRSLEINSLFTTINYINYDNKIFAPYAGVIMGYDFMKFKENLLKNTPIDKNRGYSFIFGSQIGFMIKLHKYISIYNSYKLVMSNNRIYINSSDGNSTTLLYNMNYSSEIGINVNF